METNSVESPFDSLRGKTAGKFMRNSCNLLAWSLTHPHCCYHAKSFEFNDIIGICMNVHVTFSTANVTLINLNYIYFQRETLQVQSRMDVKNNTQHGILYLEFPTEHCLKQKTIKRLNYFSCDLLFLCIYNEIKL